VIGCDVLLPFIPAVQGISYSLDRSALVAGRRSEAFLGSQV
jgi:hypothetical protein